MGDNKDILKKYVCEMPFMYSDVQWLSQFVCCPSWAPQSIRVYEDGREKWAPIDKTDDVMRNWTSPQAQDIRKSVLDGSYKYCNHKICPRLNMLPPEEILFGFDRSCNLKCPSCRVNLIPNDDLKSPEHKAKLHLLKSIEDNFGSGLKRIMITGSGDPFYSKIYRDYLINFDINKYPTLEQLQIITNGNLLDEKLWKQMKATPHIKVIEISVDASTKDTYENKTRLNGNWDKLINNLTFLATQGHIIEEFVCSMVVSKHNYKEMYMFYELITNIFKNSNFKWGLTISYRQIVDWGTYSPEDLKELQVFNEDHILFKEFLKELKRIHNLKHINHNFHHLIN